MKKLKPLVRLPIKSNPLARRIGRKLQVVREVRGLMVNVAAAQIGIPRGQYSLLEHGKMLPRQRLAQRIYLWATRGVSFEGAPPPSERTVGADVGGSRSQWKPVRVLLAPAERKQLREYAAKLGLSHQVLISLAIKMLINNRPAFHTINKAVDEINKSRAIQALTEAPELRDFLESDIEICKEAGAELMPWHEYEGQQPAIAQVVNLSLDEIAKEGQAEDELIPLDGDET